MSPLARQLADKIEDLLKSIRLSFDKDEAEGTINLRVSLGKGGHRVLISIIEEDEVRD